MPLSTRLSIIMVALAGPAVAAEPGVPTFKTEEIESSLKVGYAVLLEDLNGDKKPDIIIVDTNRVVWYENPTWKQRTIIGPKTRPDNVCITALDITGDGQLELVLGAGWKPFDTQTAGTFHWLERGKSLDDEWTMHRIPCDEPMVHRVRAIDLDGDGKKEIVHAPLIGREATKANNWMDGRPVRIMSYEVPKEPREPTKWRAEVLVDTLHVVHNFVPYLVPGHRQSGLLVASYNGVDYVWNVLPGAGLAIDHKPWQLSSIGKGNQENPKSNRGASEVEYGKLATGKRVIGTIEPWHGNQVVVYTLPKSDLPGGGIGGWDRQIIDDHIRWGHAVEFADLDGDGADELVVGVRDDPNPKAGDTFTERRGVRVYKAADKTGTKWDRTIVEDGGVAVEDLAVADLNGDGRPDIVAVGRATGNCRIYWNQGK